MIDIYLTIFYTVSIAFVGLCVPVFAVWFMLSLVSDLLFKK